MLCLMPGAAVGKLLHARVIYRGWREGRKGDMFSRKEFVSLSRFSFCRLPSPPKKSLETDFLKVKQSASCAIKKKIYSKPCNYWRCQIPSPVSYPRGTPLRPPNNAPALRTCISVTALQKKGRSREDLSRIIPDSSSILISLIRGNRSG